MEPLYPQFENDPVLTKDISNAKVALINTTNTGQKLLLTAYQAQAKLTSKTSILAEPEKAAENVRINTNKKDNKL